MSNGNSSSSAMEKDFGAADHEHLHEGMETDQALHKIKTAGSISISPELFEKLYLQPKVGAAPSTGIRNIVGTPTPVGLIGFLLSLTPLACDLMGWRGSGSENGAAGIGAYFFFGGLLMVLSGVGEFLVGSTFPSVVFFSFGAFWLTWGATLQPSYGIASIYAGAAGVPEAMGQATPGFLNAFGFIFIWMGVLCFVFMVCSLRTNITFFVIFITLVFAFCFLTAAFWHLANGAEDIGLKCVTAAGSFAFVTTVAGWYIFAAILLQSVDFPLSVPLGDLSGKIKGRSEKSMA